MAISSRQAPPWWDREVDQAGRRIRDDVRTAACHIWHRACSHTHLVLGDVADTAEFMESSVAQISRYLDRLGAPAYSENAAGLLTVAFRRALCRHAAKLQRFKTLGGTGELDELLFAPHRISLVDLRLDVEKIVRQLSARSCTIVALKSAGYEWEYVARLLRTTVPAAKCAFWREVKRARVRIKKGRSIPGSGLT